MKKKRWSATESQKRGIISLPFKIGMLLTTLALAYFLGGRLLPGQERYIYLSPDRYPPGGIYSLNTTIKKGSILYIVNDNGNFHVLIGTDPYDNCRVRWLRHEQVFASYCTDARYDIHGRWLSGPEAEDSIAMSASCTMAIWSSTPRRASWDPVPKNLSSHKILRCWRYMQHPFLFSLDGRSLIRDTK